MKTQNKLILFITGIIVTVVFFTSYLSLNLYKRMVVDIEKKNFSTLLKVFAYSCKLDIDRFIQALGEDETVLYAMVLTTDGEVLAHSEKGFEGQKLTDDVTLSAIKTQTLRFHDIMYKGQKGIDAAMPITTDKMNWLIVRIGFSTQYIERDVLKARNFILMLGALSIIFGVFIAYLISRKIISPIVKLTKKAELIAMGRRDVSFDSPVIKYPDCKRVLNCKVTPCPFYEDGGGEACWQNDNLYAHKFLFNEKSQQCETCPVFKKFMGNEINRLVETFKIMYESIKLKEVALKEDEIKLLDSEAKYKTLAESARDIIFTIDLKGKFTFINNRANDILNIESHEKLIGQSFTTILTNESRDVAFENFKKIREGKETEAFEVHAHRGEDNDQIVSLELILSPMIEGGALAGIHGIARDVSYRKLLEAQLIQTGKLSSIGELATGIAHELNQPLMIIRGYAQLINSELKESDKYFKELTLLEKQTHRMSKIINHLQAFSRQEEPHFLPVSLNEVVENSLIMVSEHLKLKKIDVIKNLNDNLPYIYADSNQLEQVLLNLITNARDAIEEKGSGVIEFKTELSDDSKSVIVKISDTGAGISKANIENIFNPFFTTKDVGKGTGLGLSISYGIIRSHHGTIAVTSKEGEGTTFTIKLPACEE